MNEELQAKLAEKIDVLATKLGVAAEHVWEILVRQQMIEGLEGLVIFLAAVTVLSLAFPALLRNIHRAEAASRNEEGEFVVKVFVYGCASVLSFALGLNGFFKIKMLLNPEFYALKEIANLFN